MSNKKFPLINRDISWLSFNHRVLQEAMDSNVPPLERLKFLGIFSNNQDEFFRVRVATLKRMLNLGKKEAKKIIGDDPSVILSKIQRIVVDQQFRFERAYQEILKELEKNDIHIINETQLSKSHGHFVKKYFYENVRPALVPVMLDNSKKFPHLKEDIIYLFVKMYKGRKPSNPRYSILEVPSKVLPRFLVLPDENTSKFVILLDDVIRYCLKDVFQIFDFNNFEAYTIKLTRDAELDLDNDIHQSHVEKIAKSIKNRKRGEPVRLVYDSNIDNELIALGVKILKLGKEDSLIPGGRYHNFKDFIKFPNLGHSELFDIPLPSLPHPDLYKQRSVFEVIRKKDILLNYPYQSFAHITDMLREAAIDPKVVSIRITIYRVANKSNIINALINAVRNGKQVTVVMEIQARFDEEANIHWGKKLQEEGAKVIYGIPGLKVHSKLLLISRKEGRRLKHYAHIGTGNFNEATSKIYSDLSLLTANQFIAEEALNVFNYLTNASKNASFKHLAVSPFNYRKKFYHLINNEIKNARKGLPAYIDIKLNSFCDVEMGHKMYEAARSGVKIRIIARGICSVVPGLKGIGENIEVISLVDRFLEHSRLFIFANGGDELHFISSADWMERNFDHRIEVTCPVYDKELQSELRTFYEMQYKGEVKIRLINGPVENEYRKPTSSKPHRAQYEIYKYYKQKLNN